MDPLIRYLNWLRSLVETPGSDGQNLFAVAWEHLYEYSVPNDDNRAQDGLDLRGRFERETSITLPDLGECTMLEFLIALSIRLNETVYNYNHPNQVSRWFWELIENLGLGDYGNYFDPTPAQIDYIEEVFERINNRTYDYDGYGGLFPLDYAKEDQRDIEVWYQMMAYLQENL